MRIAEHLPVDAVVNRNEALSSVIISSVRYAGQANMLAIFDRIGAETVQVTVREDSPAVGVELKDLALPAGALLGLVRRGDRKSGVFIPTGNFQLQAGDKAFVFATLDVVDEALALLGAGTS